MIKTISLEMTQRILILILIGRGKMIITELPANLKLIPMFQLNGMARTLTRMTFKIISINLKSWMARVL